MTEFQKAMVLMAIRQLLKLAGLAGLFTDGQLTEAIGAVLLLAGFAWSAYNEWRKTHPELAR